MKSILTNWIDTAEIEDLFITIPKGRVEMRDDRINKVWDADIDSFYLSKYLVTQGMYLAVTKENPSTYKGTNLPVETVSWIDAICFCNKLSEHLGRTLCYSIYLDKMEIKFDSKANGFRLPAEAEWQYACQAGTKKIRYGDLNKIAWYKENSRNHPHKVGEKQPNDWGLHDMLGNVWEWCSDIYDESVYGEYRVFRGGGWFDEERSVMATTRRRSHPTKFKIEDLGFRIAKNKY